MWSSWAALAGTVGLDCPRTLSRSDTSDRCPALPEYVELLLEVDSGSANGSTDSACGVGGSGKRAAWGG